MKDTLLILMVVAESFAIGFLAGRHNARHHIRESHRLQRLVKSYGLR